MRLLGFGVVGQRLVDGLEGNHRFQTVFLFHLIINTLDIALLTIHHRNVVIVQGCRIKGTRSVLFSSGLQFFSGCFEALSCCYSG